MNGLKNLSLLYLGDKNACDDGQLVQGAQSSS